MREQGREGEREGEKGKGGGMKIDQLPLFAKFMYPYPPMGGEGKEMEGDRCKRED